MAVMCPFDHESCGGCDCECHRAGSVVHLKRSLYDVRIDRQTPWGNPFEIGPDGDRSEVIAKHREWVLTSDHEHAVYVRKNVHKLRGMTLGCWCAPKPCHGDTLLDLAEHFGGKPEDGA